MMIPHRQQQRKPWFSEHQCWCGSDQSKIIENLFMVSENKYSKERTNITSSPPYITEQIKNLIKIKLNWKKKEEENTNGVNNCSLLWLTKEESKRTGTGRKCDKACIHLYEEKCTALKSATRFFLVFCFFVQRPTKKTLPCFFDLKEKNNSFQWLLNRRKSNFTPRIILLFAALVC